jgi:CheY-like chemotaxis protein
MNTRNQPRVLCVDDEPNILEGLAVNLGRSYHVMTAPSAQRALDLLRGAGEPIAIIISDMRMPVMDGTAFLSRARAIAPDAVRILLTGQSDIDSAIAAINEGQIFRFLTKPCLPSTLRMTLDAALKQYELVTAEKVLLEQTLRGSIQALVDVLALSNPSLFGRALRLKLLVSELATTLGVKEWWHIEVAAMVSQLGYIALPAETFDRVESNQPLTGEEAAMVSRAPAIAEQLLANIPRLEHVRAILSLAGKDPAAAEAASVPEIVRRGTAILRVAAEFDALDARGISSTRVVDILRSTPSAYDEATLNALEAIRGIQPGIQRVVDVHISALKPGMVLAKDVRTQGGILLAARGYQVTTGFVERAHNFREKLGRTISVIVRDRVAESTGSLREELHVAIRP